MNLVDRLLAELAKRKRRIVIVGDAMIDHWVHGYVEGCQDGCIKFIETEMEQSLGGAANARRCLSNWDVCSKLFSYPAEYYPQKWRFIDQYNKIVFRWDDETLKESSNYLWIENFVVEKVESADGVLLTDYDKGFLAPDFIKRVIDLCRKRDIACVADAKRRAILYRGATLKCNSAYATGEYGRELWNHSPSVVVTHGALNPVTYKNEEASGLGINLPEVQCVNHVGAGDCFSAHMVMAISCGFSIKEAVTFAHSAGRVYVQWPHNRAPFPHEIKADLLSAT